MATASDNPPPGVAAILASLPNPDVDQDESAVAAAAAAPTPSQAETTDEKTHIEKTSQDKIVECETNLNARIVTLLCKECRGSPATCKVCTWPNLCKSALEVLRLRYGCADCGTVIACGVCGKEGHFGCAGESTCWGDEPLRGAGSPEMVDILKAWAYLRCRVCAAYAPECSNRCRRVHWLCEHCRPVHVCDPARRSPRRVSRFLVALCQIENGCHKNQQQQQSADERVRAQRAVVKAAATIAALPRGTISERAKELYEKHSRTVKTRDMLSYCC